MYSHCPKCGHAPLPGDQAMPAACPACGVILAKVGQTTTSRRFVDTEDESESEDSLRSLLLEAPGRVNTRDWYLRLATWVLFAAWGLYLMSMNPRTGEIAGSFLHSPLLFAGVSLMDVAPYMYDAFDPKLILLGGHTGQDGQHDWVDLFSDLGLLKQARMLGLLTHRVGACVVLLALAWAAWILRMQRAFSEASAARRES